MSFLDTPAVKASALDTSMRDKINTTTGAARGALDGIYVPQKFMGRNYSKVTTSGADQTAVLQGEADALAAAGGGELYLPHGTIIADYKHTDTVSLVGVGKYVTTLKPPVGSTSLGAVMLKAGPVRGWLRNLSIRGNGNAGQRGIYFQAVGNGGTPNHGGWWNSGLDNVHVQGFAGDQIWLRGGGVDYLKPHQFLTFNDVEAYTTGTAAALRLTGQVAQVQCGGHCEFDGPAQANNGANIVITREVDDNMAYISDVAPAVIDLGITTCQNNRRGITVDRGAAISFAGWMERISEGVDASQSSTVNVSKAYFTNVGANAGNGYVLRAASSATLIAKENVFGGNVDKHIVSSFANVVQSENVTTSGAAIITEGLTPNVGITAGGAVDLSAARTALVNGSATQLITVNSNAGPGERLSLKAWGGSVILNSTGNIHASGLAMPYTVPSNGVVTLVKYDLGAVWNIESVSTQ